MLEVIQVTTTGSAGSATGSTTGTNLVHGYLMGVYIDYHASAPSTTDITISEANGLGRTLLAVSDNATDGAYNPQCQICDNGGTAKTFYWPYYLDGVNIKVDVAQSNALAPAVTVKLVIARGAGL